eukprot:2150590-Rhodomonas_salina.6
MMVLRPHYGMSGPELQSSGARFAQGEAAKSNAMMPEPSTRIPVCAGYALPGTDPAQVRDCLGGVLHQPSCLPTRCPVLTSRVRYKLRACYAMSGTELVHIGAGFRKLSLAPPCAVREVGDGRMDRVYEQCSALILSLFFSYAMT